MSEYSQNAMKIFKKLYFLENETHPDHVFKRVCSVICQGDVQLEEKFFKMMSEGYFRPNTPCLRLTLSSLTTDIPTELGRWVERLAKTPTRLLPPRRGGLTVDFHSSRKHW